jgi:hypothetical protein
LITVGPINEINGRNIVENTEHAVTGQSNVQLDNAVFMKNISNLPEGKITDIKPETYIQAAKDFLEMSSKAFVNKYPELSKVDAMYKALQQQVHLHSSSGQIEGKDATNYVRKSVLENIAEDIAEAKYPIVDHEKSKSLAETFINAKTQEQKNSAIQAHPELEQAFMFNDAMQKITGTSNGLSKSTAASIERGDIPQMTNDLKQAAEKHENNKSAELTL